MSWDINSTRSVNGLCGAHPSKEAGHERDVRDVHKVVAGRLRSDVLTDWGLRYGLPEIPRQSGDISDVGEVVVVEVDRPGVGATGQVRVGTDVALERRREPIAIGVVGRDGPRGVARCRRGCGGRRGRGGKCWRGGRRGCGGGNGSRRAGGAHRLREDEFQVVKEVAAVALVLATLGIYGVVSYAIGQRSREIGVRMALGAGRADIRNLVLRQGMLWAIVGVSIGVCAAFGLARFIANLVFPVPVCFAR